MPPPRSVDPFLAHRAELPQHYLIAHTDGGARGNPGPAGYGVVIKDETGRKLAGLSEYLGHQTNNFAEYQGLIAALEFAIAHGHKALKVVSDSELLVRQITGIYKVRNPSLQGLHIRAKELIAKLDWFSIDHALRQHNQEADRLANEAMDKGSNRSVRLSSVAAVSATNSEFEGIVQNGSIKLLNGNLPEGTRVQVRLKK